MKYFFLVLLIFPALFFYGQVSERNYIGLGIGPSIPMGDFAKEDLNDSTSGFAKTGVALVFNYSYRLTHNFGVLVMINYGSNAFNTTSYAYALGQAHDSAVSVQSNSNWSGGGILAGAFLRFPFSDHLSWDVRGSFGLYGGYSPQVTIVASNKDDPTKNKEYFRQRANAFSYAYSFGTGFKYALSNYYILLFVDYFSSPVKFDNASGWDWDNQPYVTKFQQDISTLNVTLGLGYFF